jgi:hypothetical protein
LGVQQRLRLALQVALPIAEAAGPEVAQAWFQGLNPRLEDRSPARMLRDGDTVRRFWRAIHMRRANCLSRWKLTSAGANTPRKPTTSTAQSTTDPVHVTFGYYAHGVGPETAKAPAGWQERWGCRLAWNSMAPGALLPYREAVA